MSNKELILRHLRFIFPQEVSISDLERATNVHPHQQVYIITRDLRQKGFISGRRIGTEWFFKAKSGEDILEVPQSDLPPEKDQSSNSRTFEDTARIIFSTHFNAHLTAGSLPGVPKIWDMISSDGKIVGDAKYYTLVGGTSLPPAKFATIAEHVWLLEKTSAETKFLVFGNQIEVPQLWLARYGKLLKDVQFFFMNDKESVTKLI